MAYYWKCKKHNEIMLEKLDESGTKIIPYCGYCESDKELKQIISKQNKEYQRLLQWSESSYQEKLEKYHKELSKPSFLKPLPLYLIGLVFMGLGTFGLYSYFEPDNETVTLLGVKFYGQTAQIMELIGGMINTILGGYVVYEAYTSKPTEPTKLEIDKPETPYITTLYEEKLEEFRLLQAEVEDYKSQLKRQYDSETISVYEMNEIDNLGGFEFEEYTAKLLKKLGFKKAVVTPQSGDFGADIIAIDEDNIKVAVQCKRYGRQNLVGNDAIQQIHSAKDFYDCERSMVITTSYFTKPAFQMAQKLSVELWNRKTLKEKIASLTKESWNDFLSKYYIKPVSKLKHENENVLPNNTSNYQSEIPNTQNDNENTDMPKTQEQMNELQNEQDNSLYTHEEFEQILEFVVGNIEEKWGEIDELVSNEFGIELDRYLDKHLNNLLIIGTIAVVTYYYNNSSPPYYFDLAKEYINYNFGTEYEQIFINDFFPNRKWIMCSEINSRTFWDVATIIYDRSYLYYENEYELIKSIKEIIETHSMSLIQSENLSVESSI